MVEPRGIIDTVTSVQFLKQLSRQENIAQVKGRGVWHGTDHVSAWNRMNQWVNSKVGRSTKDHITRETSLPISDVAKDMSKEHRH